MKKIHLTAAMALALSITGCGGSSDSSNSTQGSGSDSGGSTSTCDSSVSTCVTIGVYLLEGSEYVDTNKDLIYTLGASCETWSRNAQGDGHDSATHLHYNAQTSSTYDGTTFTWFEYGPETSQSAIDATCAAGTGGVQKTAKLDDYTPDKNFYVKIKSVAP